MTYRAPLAEMIFTMKAVAGLDDDAIYGDVADGMAEATLTEAAKYAENVLAPLHRAGDLQGAIHARANGLEAPPTMNLSRPANGRRR
jgi:acyl-CoA dehydrogenase